MKSYTLKLKKIIKKQKAVSPIIAAILLIGLTVLAGALVYTVVLPLLNPPPKANLTVSFKSAYDYNNDGQIDAILVTVYNNNFDSIQLTTTGLKNWEIVPMYNKTLDGMSSTDVLLITSISSAQYKVNDQVTIGLGNDVSNLSGNQITLASFTVPNPTTIFVQNAQPNTKVKFVIYPEGQSVSIAPLSLNSNDQAQVYLLPNWYKALTTDNAYSSSAFHNVLTSFVEVNEQVQPAFSTVTVSVVDNANQPVSGITVYTTDQNQNDVGINGLTDGSGKTSIYLQNGLYYFRVNYLGNDYWSSLKTVTVDSSITIKIGGNVLIGKAVFSGQGVGNGILLRLFTQNNVSMSKYSYTNASSYFYIGSVVA